MPRTEPTRTESILQGIVDSTRALAPPEAWGFLNRVPSVRQLTDDGSMLLSFFGEDYTDEELEAARVFVPARNNELCLSPILGGAESSFLILRRDQEGPPFDLVSQAGSLTTDDPPAFHSCEDHLTRTRSGRKKRILVGFSDLDVAVLRMLSLPCVPAGGLAHMNGQQVRRMLDVRINRNGSAQGRIELAPVCRDDYHLVLVAWQVAEIRNEIPNGLHEVISHLRKAEDVYECETGEHVGVWKPQASDWNQIESAVEFADRALIRRLVWKSVARSTSSLRRFEKATTTPQFDYCADRIALLEAIERARVIGRHTKEVAMRLEAFDRSFDKTVVDTIVRDAMSTFDSIDRSLRLAAADLMQQWHRSSELVQSTKQDHEGWLCLPGEVLQPEALAERLRVVNGLVKIHRELIREK